MWRASMEKALGVKDQHSWEEQLNYLQELAKKFNAFLALDEGEHTVVGLLVVGGT